MSFDAPRDDEALYGTEIVENRAWSLAQSRLFAGADDETLGAAAKIFRFLRPPAGTVVVEQGGTGGRICIVKRGWISLRRRIDDRVALPVAALGAGDVFGEETLFERPHATSAECRAETLLLASTANDVRPLLERSATLARNVAAILAERLDATLPLLYGLAAGHTIDRVLERLDKLAAEYGVAVSDGTLLDIEIGVDDLASLIGTPPDPVARALAFLQQTQVVRVNGRSITLLADRTAWPPFDRAAR